MKKRVFFQIIFLVFFSFAFAKKSDIQFSVGMSFSDYDYAVSGYKFTGSGFSGVGFSLSNFNFFDKENHFGIFEKVSFQSGEKLGLEFLIGSGFGVKVNEFLRIQAAPFFRFGLEFENDQNLSEKYRKSFKTSSYADECKFSFGTGTTVYFILFQNCKFSPLFGADFSFNFLCRDFISVDNSSYYLDYKNYSALNFQPFLGILYNF